MNLSEAPLEMIFAELRRRVGGGGAAEGPRLPLSLVALGKIVAEVHDIDAAELPGPHRTQRIAQARQQYCVAARTYIPSATLVEIAALIRRDHSTVSHALNRHEYQHRSSKSYRLAWDILTSRVAHGPCRTSPQVISGDSPASATKCQNHPTPG